jgi:hypothetical protein
LRDLVEFGRSITLMEIPGDAVFAFLALRGIAAEAAARLIQLSTVGGWLGALSPSIYEFERFIERANKEKLRIARCVERRARAS